jgi:hypothetical protein
VFDELSEFSDYPENEKPDVDFTVKKNM